VIIEDVMRVFHESMLVASLKKKKLNATFITLSPTKLRVVDVKDF